MPEFLQLIRVVVIAACVAAAAYCAMRLSAIAQEVQDYASIVDDFAPTQAAVVSKEYFTGQPGDIPPARYVRVNYMYVTQGRQWVSSCIAFRNCAGLEPEQYSRVLGRDVSGLKEGDRIPIRVSRVAPHIAYLHLESAADARREAWPAMGLWMCLIVVSLLAARTAWTPIRYRVINGN